MTRIAGPATIAAPHPIDTRRMEDVNWKRVVELASAADMVPRETLDRASRTLVTWSPDLGALPSVSRELGLSADSLRLLADLSRRLPPDAPREEVRKALADALPVQPAEPNEPGTSPTLPDDGVPRIPAPSPRIPSRLGPYEIGEEMGHGGMGMVFRARHETLGTPYAIKVLIAGEHASSRLIERFHREASLVARMGKHPNIVSVHHMAQEGPLFYFAMDLVEGHNLAVHLRDRRLSPEESARLMEKVARAVGFAHEHGVIHRDLKPENIMIAADGEPQVMDFGLARDVTTASSLTEQGQVLGTPNYMAPEQIRGDVARIDGRTDVHALGAILYELLTGVFAHRGHQIAAVFDHILSGEVIAPRRLQPDLPADLETVCLRCLLPDPRDRYASARDLADDLARFLRGEPVQARPISRLERAWRRVRRRPGVALLVAALLTTGAIAAGAAWSGWRDRRAADEERGRLVDGYVREVARSGHALVEAALARRSVADMKGSAAFAAELEEPVRELIRLAPGLAEPWYYRGRMERVLGRDKEAERCQTEAIGRAEAEGATAGSRALLPLACYERGVIRAFRYVSTQEDRRRELLTSRAASAGLLEPAPSIPTLADLEAAFPEIPGMRREAVDDLRRAVSATGEADARVLVARGILASLEGTAPEGIQADLERAIQADPYLTDAYFALAEVVSAREDAAAALEWYRRGHEADRGCVAFVQSILGRSSEVAVRIASTGGDGRPTLDAAISVAEETLERQPRDADLWSMLSQMFMARSVSEDGVDAALALLDRGMTAGARALEIDGRHVATLLSCARNRLYHAKLLRGLARDASADIEEALRSIALVREIEPRDPTASYLLAAVHASLGQTRSNADLDPSEHFARSLAVLEESGSLDPRSTDTLSLACTVHLELASWKRRMGIDPVEDLSSAVALAEKAIRLAPDSAIAAYDVAEAYRQAAHHARGSGGDPTRDYARAREGFRALLAKNPRSADGWVGLGILHHDAAFWEAANRRSPMGMFAEAIEAYDRAAEVSSDPAILRRRAQVRLDAGRCATAIGQDPAPFFREAGVDIAAALRACPDSLDYLTAAIELAWAEGEYKQRRGEDPSPDYARVVEMCGKAMEAHPRSPDLWTLRALAHREQATWNEASGKDAGAAIDAAAEDFLRAGELKPGSVHDLTMAAEAVWRRAERREASGQDDAGDYGAALSLLDGILAVRPDHWEAAFRRGQALGRLGRYEEAIAAMEQARSLGATEEAVARIRSEVRAMTEVSKARDEAGRSADEAFVHLGAAWEMGWDLTPRMERDAGFAPLVSDARWKELRGRKRR